MIQKDIKDTNKERFDMLNKTKYLGLAVAASSTLFFSGCAPVQPGYYDARYYDPAPYSSVRISLSSYSYPYYYGVPYYYYSGIYYYGGYYKNGCYYYGNRKFRHGHYFHKGYRYYNKRRYRAVEGNYGYYRSRDAYQRSSHYRNRDRNRNYTRDYSSTRTNDRDNIRTKTRINQNGERVRTKTRVNQNGERVRTKTRVNQDGERVRTKTRTKTNDRNNVQTDESEKNKDEYRYRRD